MDYICPNENHRFTLLRFFPTKLLDAAVTQPLLYEVFSLNVEIFFPKLITISVTLQAAWTQASSDLGSLCSNKHNPNFRAHSAG